MQECFDKYAADYAGFVAEGRPAEGIMWLVTGCQESPLRQSGTYVAPGRGAWAETMGRGLEGTGQVVGQRGDDSSDAKPHT